jgi:hypothetical protein
MIGVMGAVISAVAKYRVDNVPLLLQPFYVLLDLPYPLRRPRGAAGGPQLHLCAVAR